MSEVLMIKIKDLCFLEKGKIGIKKAVSGLFPLVTTADKRLTHNEYHFDAPSVVIPVVSSTGHGHASLKRIHYQEGKFAVGSILCVVTPKDSSLLSALYLYHYLNLYKEQLLVSRMRGMANVTLPIKAIGDVEVPLPSIKVQHNWVSLLENISMYSEDIFSKAIDQENILKQLRQSILQEAIEGKLTADWRKQNPVQKGNPDFDAEALLEKIKIEKEKLIKDGKIKKQKPLASIKLEEIPFELPDGWAWVRLQDAGIFERGKSKHRPRNDEILFKNGMYPFVQTGDVAQSKKYRYLISSYTKAYNKIGLNQSRLWEKGTLCITIAANIAETGFLNIDACFPDSIVGFTAVVDHLMPSFVKYFIDVSKVEIEKFAPATAQMNINLGIINELLFPMPAICERKIIVERVDKLMVIIDELEKQVIDRKAQSKKLMQSVLKEAFA